MNKFTYYTRLSNDHTTKGVKQKIENTVKAINKSGYSGEMEHVSKPGIFGHIRMFKKLISSQADVIIYRATPFSMSFIFYALLYLRIKGRIIIIDIPTPISVLVQEIKSSDGKNFTKYLKVILLYITLPFGFFPANRILQYSYESKWFSMGLKNKTILVGNGVLIDLIPFSDNIKLNTNVINFISVSSLSVWHGCDRMIASMYEYKKAHKLNINFYIVGEGTEKEHLVELVDKLGLKENVFFEGYKTGTELDSLYQKSHIALGSLSMYKIDLYYASVLKAREYTARGIPFILACKDIDFAENLDFVYHIKNDNSNLDLKKIIDWYNNLKNQHKDFSYIRKYAYEHLDMQNKVKKYIISILEEK